MQNQMLKKRARKSVSVAEIPQRGLVKSLKVPRLIKDKTKGFNFKTENDLFKVHDLNARLSSKDYKKIIPDRYVGIEIELNNAGLNKSETQAWKDLASYCSAVKTDGSVDGDGIELNTIPSRGLAFHKQLEVVGGSLKKLGAKANKSCGLHVHVDAADYSGFDTFKLAFLWAQIEDLVFATLPAQRQNNTYCQRLSKDTRQKILMSKHLLAHTSPRQVIERFSIGDKYHGLNFGAWYRLKTFEFRCHEGVSDGTEMALWGMMVAEIVSYAKRTELAKIRATEYKDLSVIFGDNKIILRYINSRSTKVKKVAKTEAFL